MIHLFFITYPRPKAVACNTYKNNAYIGVSKLNYFSISLKKKIAKAESGHLSVINCLYIFWFHRAELIKVKALPSADD